MFPQTDPRPRLFGLPPGADFGSEVVAGIAARMGDAGPEAWARVTILVNTRRMARRLREVFDEGPARLLPRIRLITDLALDPVAADLPLPVAPLRRRLELSQLVAGLLDRTPDLAPRAALFDLADSLAALMDEMQGEGVSPDKVAELDVTDLSGHWARALQFLTIVQRYFDPDLDAPDREARQRLVIERLCVTWAMSPPTDPFIVAGSTGSRGATALLLRAVAQLPQGAVILPGFDFDMPPAVWATLDDAMTAEDHPQFRFRKLLHDLDMSPGDVQQWTTATPPNPARNRLISLSLRPAPVTDQWRLDGPALGDLGPATERLTLVEAPSPRAEAEAIALRLRHAVDEGITAALITPDRMLTRQVAAALDRWKITPDDSAGVPLPLTPPGRFLRQVAALFGQKLTAEALLSILRHPLCHSGTERGLHSLYTSELELELRRNGPPFPDGTALIHWAKGAARTGWARWLAGLIDGLEFTGTRSLADHLALHLDLAQRLAAGPVDGSGGLWDKAEGRKARAICDDIALHADAAGLLSARDYAALFSGILNTAEVRNPDKVHPQIRIWGTLEARVQGADLIILGGMNEGIWPQVPAPDPWLNRQMRLKAGLLLPERRIGLAAHDYTQAVAGREVWITRAIRSADAQTLPSRWINRLTNLLEGLPDQRGDVALAAMRARGEEWLARAAVLSAPAVSLPPAHRPSPRPPVGARPRQLSVTRITTLLRDPYAIYAERVLRLSALDPLTASPDAPLRGIIVHRLFERFIRSGGGSRQALMRVAADVLTEECPWPTVRALWLARIGRVADWFIKTEAARQAIANPHLFEVKGKTTIANLNFTLTGAADRIDLAPDGSIIIYDYKTGAPPTEKEQKAFEKQLLLEAAMAERGAFSEVGPVTVTRAEYIGVGAKPCIVPAPLGELPAGLVWAQFCDFIQRWDDPTMGYTARRAVKRTDFPGSYDHLSRFGEWDQSTPPMPEDLT
jgi:ATP-dependent helicase/nuclease subunit B